MAWYIVLAVIALALIYIFYNYARIRRLDEGTEEMAQMAAIIRSGGTSSSRTKALRCLPRMRTPVSSSPISPARRKKRGRLTPSTATAISHGRPLMFRLPAR